MPDRAAVYFRDRKAGTLSRLPTGYEFAYDPGYASDPSAQPISLSLPLRPEKYSSPVLFPFFEGLLPEGWLLDLVSSTAKIDKADRFRLLLHACADPIGAVSLSPLEPAAHG